MKRRNRPVLATLSVAFLAAVAAMVAAFPVQAATSTSASSQDAQSSTTVITYQPATLLIASSMSSAQADITAGSPFKFTNGDSAAPVTISATSPNWTIDIPLGPGATSADQSVPVGTYTYKAVGTNRVGLVLTGGTATGTITATTATSAPSGVGSNPAATSSAPAVPGVPVGKAPPALTGGAPANPAVPAAPGVPPASAGAQGPGPQLLYPGGVVGSIAPGATVNGLVPAPEVAPYATSTAPDGQVTTLYSTHTPTDSPSPAAALGGDGGSGSGRGLGLPAAVTAVILIGLLVTLFRLLLTHPAARAIARRH